MRTVAGCIEDPAMASCPDGDPETTEEGEPDMDFIHDPLFPDLITQHVSDQKH
jgi:hypothetical protein